MPGCLVGVMLLAALVSGCASVTSKPILLKDPPPNGPVICLRDSDIVFGRGYDRDARSRAYYLRYFTNELTAKTSSSATALPITRVDVTYTPGRGRFG